MIYISDPLREYRLVAVKDFLNLGSSPAKILVFSGPRAATITDPPPFDAHQLIALTLAKPCGLVQNGMLTLDQPISDMVMITGEPTWARAINGHGDIAFDCDAGGPAILGNWELKMNKDILYAGGYAYMNSAIIR